VSSRERWDEIYKRKGVEVGVDKGDFIVAISEEKAYALSPAVYYIWSLCDGETSIGTIVENLMQNLGSEVNIEDVYKAVITIIDKLAEVDLIEKVK